jgi:hypothetical protein
MRDGLGALLTFRTLHVCAPAMAFLLGCIAAAWPQPTGESASNEFLPGFHRSPHFDEWVKEMALDPDAQCIVNAPADFTRDRPTEVVFYALPNGNTLAQTIGRRMTEGLNWHFDIQHIGAQTRALREVMTDRNLVVAYLMADSRSWPTWRRTHENSSALIAEFLEEIFPCTGDRCTWALTAHSGGGSLIFGYLNGVDRIPDRMTRIAFLDADYSYSDEDYHGDKLLEWLHRSPENHLVVLAYDDRNITLNGQRVVSDTGGTFRATTQRLIPRLERDVQLTETREGDFLCWRGMNGQIDIRVHTNPDNKILHTVLVGEMNGFIHALTVGTPFEGQAGTLGMGRAYEEWIQDGD